MQSTSSITGQRGSSLEVTFLISSAVMQSGMAVCDSIALIVMCITCISSLSSAIG